jgi:cytochrome c oxidase accessory protein FixG
MSEPTQAGAAVEEKVISLYAAQKKIYPRTVQGLFARWRWVFVWMTQLVFYGLPWLEWNQRQGVLFDLEARRFYIFNLVLYPQDFIYLTGLLVISALSLFLFTAVAGRLWCGYACPQTVYSEIFMWIERRVEGDRGARIRLDKSPFSMGKFGRKSLKHALWIALALWTGFTFVGYFTPIRELASEVMANALGPWQTFWVLFYGFATYGNAGFMREQVCKYMCPYARFQSAMFDQDTMIVTYDKDRGEPRGARKKGADAQSLNLGSCIDCGLCVQVCPTGIDIRNGLQYECIGCGACIDVCDDVMDKVGYPKGLVKYSTQRGMALGWSRSQILRHALRPRVLVYTGILLAVTLAIAISVLTRPLLRVDVIRDRGAIARMVERGQIENVYRLNLMNASEQPMAVSIGVTGADNIMLASEPDYTIGATEVRAVAIRVRVPPMSLKPGSHDIQFVVNIAGSDTRIEEASTFIVPR